jgi:hypothetical protein
MALGVVVEVELDLVADPYPDKLAGHAAAEGPEGVVHAVRQAARDLAGLEVHHHAGG